MRQSNDLTLNFYLLKCLVALVDQSHVTRAADSLSISQPAMSRAMQQLRTLTGDPILVRGEGGLVATAKAIKLRDFALRILKEMDELLGHAVAFVPQTTRRTFTIVATDYLECVYLDAVASRLTREYPAISISVRHPAHPRDLNKLLESGEADFCVGMLPATLEDLRHRPLFQDQVACIAGTRHPAVGQELTPAQFAALDHVVIRPTVHTFAAVLDEQLSAQQLARTQKLATPNYLSVPWLVERGDTVAVVPESLARRFCAKFEVTRIPLPLPVPGYDVYLYWHERTQHHLDHVWFRTQLMRAAQPQS